MGLLVLILLGGLLAGCGGSSSSSPAGTVTLSLTDAPADDCTQVIISIAGLVFKVEGEEEPAVLVAADAGDVQVVLDPP